MMSSGKNFILTFIYSGVVIGDAKHKYFMSALKNVSPLSASEMKLLINIFVSTILDAGNPASSL